MTVAELIRQLSSCEPNAEVFADGDDCSDWPVRSVLEISDGTIRLTFLDYEPEDED